jgi:hypothetical protein
MGWAHDSNVDEANELSYQSVFYEIFTFSNGQINSPDAFPGRPIGIFSDVAGGKHDRQFPH